MRGSSQRKDGQGREHGARMEGLVHGDKRLAEGIMGCEIYVVIDLGIWFGHVIGD
jgi:hypothetical protein